MDILHAKIQKRQQNDDSLLLIPRNVVGDGQVVDIVEHAKRCAAPTEIETGELIGGFAHAQVLALADQVVDAVHALP